MVALYASENGRGIFVEIGAALAAGIPVHWFEDTASADSDVCVFQNHPGVRSYEGLTFNGFVEYLIASLERLDNAKASAKVQKGGLTVADLCVEAHETAKTHGFWEKDAGNETILAKLALVHTEISEAVEEIRAGYGPTEVGTDKDGRLSGFGYELADIIIRTADISERYGINLEYLTKRKLAANKNRPYMHGKAF